VPSHGALAIHNPLERKRLGTSDMPPWLRISFVLGIHPCLTLLSPSFRASPRFTPFTQLVSRTSSVRLEQCLGLHVQASERSQGAIRACKPSMKSVTRRSRLHVDRRGRSTKCTTDERAQTMNGENKELKSVILKGRLVAGATTCEWHWATSVC